MSCRDDVARTLSMCYMYEPNNTGADTTLSRTLMQIDLYALADP